MLIDCNDMTLTGSENLYKNMTEMLGFRPLRWFYYCWMIFAPAIIFVRQEKHF